MAVTPNLFCEQTITWVKDIFSLRQHYTLIMNKIIYDAFIDLLNEIKQLNGAHRSRKNVNLLVAAKKL